MNIDEERKAFEASLKASVEYGDYDDKEYLFPIWLAAKAHAEEMAKPVATYSTFNDLVVLYGNEKTYFNSVADAKVWASNNGYRVAE